MQELLSGDQHSRDTKRKVLAQELNNALGTLSFTVGKGEIHSHKTNPVLVLNMYGDHYAATLSRDPQRGKVDPGEFQGMHFQIVSGGHTIAEGRCDSRSAFLFKYDPQYEGKEATITFSA